MKNLLNFGELNFSPFEISLVFKIDDKMFSFIARLCFPRQIQIFKNWHMAIF